MGRKRKMEEVSPKRAQQAGSLIAINIYQHHRRTERNCETREKSQLYMPDNLTARWHLELKTIQQNLSMGGGQELTRVLAGREANTVARQIPQIDVKVREWVGRGDGLGCRVVCNLWGVGGVVLCEG